MSIADDPFCRGLSQALCDLIEAALSGAQGVMEDLGKELDALRRKAYEMGVSPQGFPRGQGNAILEDADDMARKRNALAARSLFDVAHRQWWKALRPDIDAFVAKAWEASHWVNQKLHLNPGIPPNEFEFKRKWREWALRELAASEEADSRNPAQSSRNKAAAGRSRSKSADALRRMICEMKSAKYSHQKMCRALDERGIGTPEHANWGDHNWSDAFRDPTYKPSVKKYLSHVTSEASA
jgi:hypothetical protein